MLTSSEVENALPEIDRAIQQLVERISHRYTCSLEDAAALVSVAAGREVLAGAIEPDPDVH